MEKATQPWNQDKEAEIADRLQSAIASELSSPDTETAASEPAPESAESASRIANVYAELPSTFTGFLWQVLLGSPESDSSEAKGAENAPSSESKPEIHEDTEIQHEKTEIYAKRSESNSSLAMVGSILTNYVLGLSVNSPESVDSAQSKTEPEVSEAENQFTMNDQVSSALDLLSSQDTLIVLKDRDPKYVKEPILTERMASMIYQHLPARYRPSALTWHLVYSMEQHGISLNTFYKNTQKYCLDYCDENSNSCPMVMLIRERDSADIFGAFTVAMWKPNSGSGAMAMSPTGTTGKKVHISLMAGSVSHGRSFYGGGESFLLRFNESGPAQASTADAPTRSQQQRLEVFEWTGNNDYFMLSESDFLAMGGGNGAFSLYLDSELYQGFSASTPTFANKEPLCADRDKGEFYCVGLEVWGIIEP